MRMLMLFVVLVAIAFTETVREGDEMDETIY